MPELPEVETTRRGIIEHVQNRVVERVEIHNPSLRWPVSNDLVSILPGQTIHHVGRRSKYLLFKFDHGTLIFHLGMTGHLRISPQGVPKRKHDHFELFLSDKMVLRFNDSRRFGAILWTEKDPLLHERLVDLGPEPCGDKFNSDYLYEKSRRRKIAIKQLIMDARVVVGVGNIYANEALFRAGISPSKLAGRIDKSGCSRLVESVNQVLLEAVNAGGTTIRNFFDSSGKPGYFKAKLNVYGRSGQGCVTCNATIKTRKIGQRSTFFCPKCQK